LPPTLHMFAIYSPVWFGHPQDQQFIPEKILTVLPFADGLGQDGPLLDVIRHHET
jgi:hypothetical protein